MCWRAACTRCQVSQHPAAPAVAALHTADSCALAVLQYQTVQHFNPAALQPALLALLPLPLWPLHLPRKPLRAAPCASAAAGIPLQAALSRSLCRLTPVPQPPRRLRPLWTQREPPATIGWPAGCCETLWRAFSLLACMHLRSRCVSGAPAGAGSSWACWQAAGWWYW